jgi:hypothetical protein
MKSSKFDSIYQNSYKIFLNEEAPMPSDITNQSNLNNASPAPDENPPEEQINQSELPDPNDVIGVKTDMLKIFQDFFNIDQQRQEEFKRTLAAKSIDDKNAEPLIAQLKEFIASGEKPKQSSI